MQKKIGMSKIVVYTIIGIIVLAAVAAAIVYLPGLMQIMHGIG